MKCVRFQAEQPKVLGTRVARKQQRLAVNRWYMIINEPRLAGDRLLEVQGYHGAAAFSRNQGQPWLCFSTHQ